MTHTVDWISSDEFGVLCDLVASDAMVCLTGAGVSRGMRRAKPAPDGSDKIPGWIDLLRELYTALASDLSPNNSAVVGSLLAPEDERPAIVRLKNRASATTGATGWLEDLSTLGPPITSRELIVAASLLRRANPTKFDELFRAAVTEQSGSFSLVHSALLQMEPRGILTFNYDCGHESACDDLGRTYQVLDPNGKSADEEFGAALRARLKQFFIVKAHGSLSPSAHTRLTLTFEDYRDLISRNPAYRAFIQNLFTNFHFVLFGYGLDDPDFDLFLWSMAEHYGAPVHTHIVVRPYTHRTRRQEVERVLYGIRTLSINEWDELPLVLTASSQTAGPTLRRTLEKSLSPRHDDRVASHAELRQLGSAGKKVASFHYLRLIDDQTLSTWRRSEAAFCLGVIDAQRHKERLMRLVDDSNESDILARSLTQLRSVLLPTDLPRVEDWKRRFIAAPPDGDRPERILEYVTYLCSYVVHKFQSDPSRP